MIAIQPNSFVFIRVYSWSNNGFSNRSSRVCIHLIVTTPAQSAGYTLRDGSRVHLRPIRPEDDHALVEAFERMSPETVYQRFFAALPELSEDAAWRFSHVDYTSRMALVAECADSNPPGLIAIARYERSEEPGVVELGLVVLDPWQNRGLGRIMIRALLEAAARNGISRFRAEILSDNRRMLHLLATEAHILESKSQSGITTVLLEPAAKIII
jgi:RimJ/RimL family protein N-acetyltransferase